jgi:hypothetical protein
MNVAALVGEKSAKEFNPSARVEKKVCGTSSIFINVDIKLQDARRPVNTTRHALKQIHPPTFFPIAPSLKRMKGHLFAIFFLT